MHILNSSAQRNCTSCQVCAAVCPKEAITIDLNPDGFYRPLVNESKCIDCGLCTTVCYKFTVPQPTKADELSGMPVYAASAKNTDTLRQTSSGGVADVLARHLVNKGWICVGVEYNDQTDKARHSIASSENEVKAFRGSKYIQSYTLDAFREIVQKYLTKKVAVFGTPCQTYALDLFLKRRGLRDNYLLIDMYCHGCPSMFVWDKYINRIRKQKNISEIHDLTFRSKAKGWGTFHVGINSSGQETDYISPRSNDDFFTLFFSDHVLNKACHDCLCRSTMKHTDIRLGDFWGKAYDLNREGVSIVTCVTDHGHTLFKELQAEFTVKQHIHADYLPYQSYGRNYSPNERLRRQMLENLADPSSQLEETIRLFYKNQPISYHFKRHLKNLVLNLPPLLVNWAKRFYH